MRAVERGEAGCHDNVVAVPGNHHQPALGEHAKAARDALGEHRHILDASGQVTLAEHLRVQLPDEVTHPQPGQLRAMRHRSDEAQPTPVQRLAQLCCRRRVLRRHAVDHARVLAGKVPARRDGERLSQTLDGARERVQPGLRRAAWLILAAPRIVHWPAGDQRRGAVVRPPWPAGTR